MLPVFDGLIWTPRRLVSACLCSPVPGFPVISVGSSDAKQLLLGNPVTPGSTCAVPLCGVGRLSGTSPGKVLQVDGKSMLSIAFHWDLLKSSTTGLLPVRLVGMSVVPNAVRRSVRFGLL